MSELNGFLRGRTEFQKSSIRRTLNKLSCNIADRNICSRAYYIEHLFSTENLDIEWEKVNRIKPLSRLAFFRSNALEQKKHEQLISRRGTKTIYIVGEYVMPKTAYDYAAFLLKTETI